jgi:acid phosphatase class B
MEKKQIITLVFIVLVLLFFLNHMAVATTNSIVPTTSGTNIYKQPSTATTYYVSGGKSNPYKAQYYN